MGRAYSTHGRGEKCMKICSRKRAGKKPRCRAKDAFKCILLVTLTGWYRTKRPKHCSHF
jgi:hypothetical protein